MPGSLDRDALRELLDELSRELEHRRTRAQIYIIGGAAISLAFDRRRTTHDVDARIESGHGQLIEAARTIGRRRGLPESWLNEQATAHMPKTRDTQARTVYESEYLTITGASAEHILAMKLEAGRGQDVEDVATLMRHLNIDNENDALAIHRRLFPGSKRTEKARMVIGHVLGRTTGGAEQRRTDESDPPMKPQVSALARKIEIARSEIGKGQVEMSLEAGRWWVRYVSTSTPNATRWLGPVADTDTVAEAMHHAGEIESDAISDCAGSLRATARNSKPRTSPIQQATANAAAKLPTPRERAANKAATADSDPSHSNDRDRGRD